MRFLIDEQLLAALVGWLQAEGLEAVHVSMRFGYGASDTVVAGEAERLQAVLVTKDADFVHKSAAGSLGRPVVWVRCGNVSNKALWETLRPALPKILLELERGARVVQVV